MPRKVDASMSNHSFVFAAAALAAAASFMVWNKGALTFNRGEDPGEGFDQDAGEGLGLALEKHVPGDVDPYAWMTAICEQADPETWAEIQALQKAQRQAQEDEQRERAERNRKIAAAVASAAGVPAFAVRLAHQTGAIGIAPGATTAIEVPGVGTFHVWGLDNLKQIAGELPPGMLDLFGSGDSAAES